MIISRDNTFKERLEKFKSSRFNHLSYNLLLYDFPELYYAYLPDPDIYRSIDLDMQKYCNSIDKGILDLGCGGGKVLAGIGNNTGNTIKKVGVDAHEAMIQYGIEKYGDTIEFHIGDVKTFRYAHKFSIVLCVGTVLQYAYTNDEIESVLKTCYQHLLPGGLLLLDIKNSSAYLNGLKGLEKLVKQQEVNYNFFRAVKRPRYELDLKHQLLRLWVDWEVLEPTLLHFTDFCQFRMIFPQELLYFIEKAGFEIKDLRDGFKETSQNFSHDRIVVAATKK
jgi:SAM-dependent methyltransferase